MPAMAEDYDDTVGFRRKMIKAAKGLEPGDPKRVGDAVVMPSRLAATSPPRSRRLSRSCVADARHQRADRATPC